ncbi:MAG: tetratricopeptide repeat protein [Fimbriimonas sp.]|nr:tetratricopeptide repeat protein [Fimbriimonas sp.]
MVACKHCSTPNTLDSTFCKRCGTALPEDAVQAAKEKLDALVSEGNVSFNEGRTDEALAVADSAVASNPSSIGALSLKTLCHERRGELAEALECAEKIVELNPDSELDKIKRNQLRSKLAATVQLATNEPDRKLALIGAISAVILFICVGIGAAKLINRTDSSKSAASGTKIESAPPPLQQTQPAANQQVAQNNAPPVQQSSARNNNQGQGDTSNMAGDSDREPPLVLPNAPGSLPLQGNGSGTLEVGSDQNPAVRGIIGGNGSSSNSGGTVAKPIVSNNGNGRTGEVGGDPNPGTLNPTGGQAAEDPGKIEINLSSGASRPSFGGSQSVSTGGISALVHVGMQRFQLGQFSAAASTFEQALKSGGDQITLNQRLGQCYDNLGRKNDAVEAYKRGIAACQSALASGTGNRDGIQKRLDSCQQALKVLQGN